MTTTLDPGQSYQKQKTTAQTMDYYGNLTAMQVYGFNGSLARTYSNYYLTDGNYTSRDMFNRLTASTVNGGGQTSTLVSNSFGRAIKSETGDSRSTKSVVDTVYAPCGCSPLGKGTQVSQPHTPGATQYWTVNTYDATGRTIKATSPDEASATTYSYQGNTVTVTDAAGKWKKYTMDVFGNLSEVDEPTGSSTYYAYDVLNHLTNVNMGSQTRTFNYVNGGYVGSLLQSTTNPETGTVTYSYNSDLTLHTKTDAKGQRYYSNSLGRFTRPDPAMGSTSANNPQSWNRYSYVINEPVNSWDPEGLCSVLLAGITQGPNTNDNLGSAEEFANEVGAITAFPYAGGRIIGDLANIVQQGMGIPTGATLTALEAIALAAQNPGPISVFAFSGGAAAFARAWNYLTPAVQSRIQSVTYIDPGSAQSLQPGSGSVDVYDDAKDLANIAIQLVGGAVPLNSRFHDTGNCGHNWDCVFQRYSDSLSKTATSCETGAGGTFGAANRTVNQFVANSFGGFFWYFWEIPPVPSVVSTIRYDLP